MLLALSGGLHGVKLYGMPLPWPQGGAEIEELQGLLKLNLVLQIVRKVFIMRIVIMVVISEQLWQRLSV